MERLPIDDINIEQWTGLKNGIQNAGRKIVIS